MVWRVLGVVGMVWLGLLGASPATTGQISSGQLAGVVTDESGAPVPGAAVTVTAVDSNRSRSLTTNASGSFVATAIAPGRYQLRVELSGFRPLVRRDLVIVTGETLRVDVALEVGGLSEVVQVGADRPLLRQTAPASGRPSTRARCRSCRSTAAVSFSLAGLAPGVALPANSSLPRINGGRPRTNEYLFDGISVLQPEPGQIAYFPIIDAIQEFRIESNSPPAEFGRFNGGVINLTTKAGGNVVRGTAFEFFRHEALNARNLFAGDAEKPRFRRQQFGGVAGGPVRRGRTFFFVDYQGQRQTIGRTRISTVPTLPQRQGVFTEPIAGRTPAIYDPLTTTPLPGGGATRIAFPDHTIPANRIDATALALLSRYPQPTSAGTVNNYRRVVDETADQDQADVRLDHHFGTRDQLFGPARAPVGRDPPVGSADGGPPECRRSVA